jgi:hypothetical protein
MSWVDQLSEHGKKRKRKATSDKPASAGPPPPLQEISISIRGASGNDPGEIAAGFYIVQRGVVTIVNRKGEPVKDVESVQLDDPSRVHAVASRLLRKVRQESGSDFNRRLNYGPLGWM